MATTIHTLAKCLNLSPSIVARVLKNQPNTRVAAETRQRILALAQEMGYAPSPVARALATGRTMQMMIAGSRVQEHLLEHMMQQQGFINAAAQRHYWVTVLPLSDDATDRQKVEAMIRSGAWDGVCLDHGVQWLLPALRERGVPFLFLGNPGDASLPQVDHDNYQYAYDSVAWLHRQGHARIALADFADPQQNPYVRVVQQGYCAAMETLCGGFAPEWMPPRPFASDAERVAFVRQEGVTALISRDIESGGRWKRSLQRAALRVPEDVTVLVHIATGERFIGSPGMAYHAHDPYALGEKAGELLTAHLDGAAMPASPVLIPTQEPHWYQDIALGVN